jgi:hypothetical protein
MTGLNILANRCRLEPEDVRRLLVEILEDGPTAASAARTIAVRIGGPSMETPRLTPSEPPDHS